MNAETLTRPLEAQAAHEAAAHATNVDEATVAVSGLMHKQETAVYDEALANAQDFYGGVFSTEANQTDEVKKLTHTAAEQAVERYREQVREATNPSPKGKELVHLNGDIEKAAHTTPDDGTVYVGGIVGEKSDDTKESDNFVPLSRRETVTAADAAEALKHLSEVDPRDVLSAGLLRSSFQDLEPALAKTLPTILANAKPVKDGFSTLRTSWTDERGTTYSLTVDYVGGREAMREGSDKLARKAMDRGDTPKSIRLMRENTSEADDNRLLVSVGFPSETNPDDLGSMKVHYSNTDPSKAPEVDLAADPFSQAGNQTLRLSEVDMYGTDLRDNPDKFHPDDFSQIALGLRELAGELSTRYQEQAAQPPSNKGGRLDWLKQRLRRKAKA